MMDSASPVVSSSWVRTEVAEMRAEMTRNLEIVLTAIREPRE